MGVVNRSIVDFSVILPTLAEVGSARVPSELDGAIASSANYGAGEANHGDGFIWTTIQCALWGTDLTPLLRSLRGMYVTNSIACAIVKGWTSCLISYMIASSSIPLPLAQGTGSKKQRAPGCRASSPRCGQESRLCQFPVTAGDRSKQGGITTGFSRHVFSVAVFSVTLALCVTRFASADAAERHTPPVGGANASTLHAPYVPAGMVWMQSGEFIMGSDSDLAPGGCLRTHPLLPLLPQEMPPGSNAMHQRRSVPAPDTGPGGARWGRRAGVDATAESLS